MNRKSSKPIDSTEDHLMYDQDLSENICQENRNEIRYLKSDLFIEKVELSRIQQERVST